MGNIFDNQNFYFLSIVKFNLFSNGYIIFFGFGFFLFLISIIYESQKVKIKFQLIILLLVSCAIGLLSARSVNLIKDFIIYGFNWEKLFSGGIAYIGSLYGGLLSLYFFIKWKKYKLFPFMDIVALFIPLGHSFGRIGCFYAGCCFGKPTSCAIGIKYPYMSYPYQYQLEYNFIKETASSSLPIYPVQLFESFGELTLFLFLLYIYKRKDKRTDGIIVISYLTLYSVMRFFLEFIRGDDHIQDSLPLGRSGGTLTRPLYYPPSLLISSYVISMSVPG